MKAWRAIVTAMLAVLALAACTNAKWDGKTQPSPSTVTTTEGEPGVTDSPVEPTSPAAQSASPSPTPQPVKFTFTVPVRTTSPGFRSSTGDAKAEYEAGEYAKIVFFTSDKFWQGVLAAADYNWGMSPQWRIVNGSLSYPSKCMGTSGDVLPSSRIFYCGDDGDSQVHGFVYLPSQTYWAAVQQFSQHGTQALRNFVATIIAANVFAYHAVHMLALNMANYIADPPSLDPAQTTLMASCLTGIWIRAAYPPGETKAATLNVGVAAFTTAVGLPQSNGPTPAAIWAAFDQGFQNHSVATCGNGNWPGTIWS